MDNNAKDNVSTKNDLMECIALLRDCLRIVTERQRRYEQEERMLMEERSMHEDQYPGDELGLWFYNEDFKFDWL